MGLALTDFISHQAFADLRGMHDVCASGWTHERHHLPSSTHTAKTGKLFIPGSRKGTTLSIHGRELGPERHMGVSKSKSYENFSHTTDQENYMIISSGPHKVNNSTAMVMAPQTTCHLLIQHMHQRPISKELNDWWLHLGSVLLMTCLLQLQSSVHHSVHPYGPVVQPFTCLDTVLTFCITLGLDSAALFQAVTLQRQQPQQGFSKDLQLVGYLTKTDWVILLASLASRAFVITLYVTSYIRRS